MAALVQVAAYPSCRLKARSLRAYAVSAGGPLGMVQEVRAEGLVPLESAYQALCFSAIYREEALVEALEARPEVRFEYSPPQAAG